MVYNQSTMLVEELPKPNTVKSSTVYFTSSINLTARLNRSHANADGSEGGEQNKKSRAKVNYNLTLLMNAQTQTNDVLTRNGPLKSAQQIQLERVVSKRLNDLNREASAPSFELPKNLIYSSIHNKEQVKENARIGNTPTTKKILLARRNLNLYFEEERNLISVNTILNLNFQFIDNIETASAEGEPKAKRRKHTLKIKPRLKLCCVCGDMSNYPRCGICGLYCCSVGCVNLHNELRCL